MGLSEAVGQQQVRGPRGKAQRSVGVGGDRDKAKVSHLPATAPPATAEHRRGKSLPPKTPTHRPHGPPGAAEAWRSAALHREKWFGGQGSERQETRREQDREEGKTGLPGCQGPRRSVRLSRPLVGKLRRETAPRPPAPAPGGAAVQILEVTVEAAHLPVKPGLPHSSS